MSASSSDLANMLFATKKDAQKGQNEYWLLAGKDLTWDQAKLLMSAGCLTCTNGLTARSVYDDTVQKVYYGFNPMDKNIFNQQDQYTWKYSRAKQGASYIQKHLQQGDKWYLASNALDGTGSKKLKSGSYTSAVLLSANMWWVWALIGVIILGVVLFVTVGRR